MKRRCYRWTDEELVEQSKRFAGLGRSGYAYGDPSQYSISLKRGLLDKMSWLGTKNNPHVSKMYVVYRYMFSDNSVYVGLTMRPKFRAWQHTVSGSPVFMRSEKLHEHPEMEIVKSDLSVDEARCLEDDLVKEYSKTMNVLNKGKTGRYSGALGSVINKWTRERLIEVAKQYKSRREMSLKCAGAYRAALKMGISKELPIPMYTSGWQSGNGKSKPVSITLEKLIDMAGSSKNVSDMISKYGQWPYHVLRCHKEWYQQVYSQFNKENK